MGFEKRTVKIIAIVVVLLLVIAGLIGLLLGLLLPQRYVEMEVWPHSDEYNREQPLIHFRVNDPGSWHPWYNRITEFLRDYETNVPEDPPRAPCSVLRHEHRVPDPNCERALSVWAPCIADNFYGYRDGTPCVFLRLSHIHYWVPEPYNASMPLALPPEMPNNIKQIMMQRPAHVYGDYVWVSCGGEFAADQENIGPLQFVPAALPPGFPTARLATADHVPRAARSRPDPLPGPLIAVLFENPRQSDWGGTTALPDILPPSSNVTLLCSSLKGNDASEITGRRDRPEIEPGGVLINVECRIWTRDITYERTSRVGRARFEIQIE